MRLGKILKFFDGSDKLDYRIINENAEKIDGCLSNENLLDNPWFTVNQRGQSSYEPINSRTYSVDRWLVGYASGILSKLDVVTNGINYTSGKTEQGIFQELEDGSKYVGKTLTLSAKIDGEISSIRIDMPTEKPSSNFVVMESFGKYNLRFVWTVGNDKLNIVIWSMIANNTLNIQSVKLELGSVSTIANDSAPDYQTELLKCQRYFERILIGSNVPYVGVWYNQEKCYNTLLTFQKKRTTPSISIEPYNSSYPNGRIITPNQIVSATSIIVHGAHDDKCRLKVNYPSMITESAWMDNLGYFNISADL